LPLSEQKLNACAANRLAGRGFHELQPERGQLIARVST
jgi:hypothetical protein